MSETSEQPKTRVTRITMGRVYNLGNYENQRIEISVDIADGDDPAKIFKNLQAILGNLRAKSGVEGYQVTLAHEIVAKKKKDLTQTEKDMLDSWKDIVAKDDAARARRAAAQAALSTLEFNYERKDHKLDWDDGDYNPSDY